METTDSLHEQLDHLKHYCKHQQLALLKHKRTITQYRLQLSKIACDVKHGSRKKT